MVDKKIQNFVSDLGIMSRTETRTTGILAAAGGLKLIVGGVTKIGIVTGVGASLGPIMIPLTLMMGWEVIGIGLWVIRSEIEEVAEMATTIVRGITETAQQKQIKRNIVELNLSNQNLKGDLELYNYINLEKLNCSNNQLTGLDLSKLRNLKELNCSDNEITYLDLSQNKKLTKIKYENNLYSSIFLLPEILSSNKIDDLWKCFELQEIDCSNNKLTYSLDYLSNMSKLKRLNISNTDINEVNIDKLPRSLEIIEYSVDKRPGCKLIEIVPQLEKYEWKDVHSGFVLESRRGWEKKDFNKEQTQEWINAGAKPDDYIFVNWLINIKNLNLEWALNNQEEFQNLRDKYQYFGTCQECSQPNVGRNWCQSCNKQHFQQEKWTSENYAIDQFIKKYQLEATDAWNILEWIPYEQFENIEHIADGGFAKVYKAKWDKGSIKEWSIENNDWKRGSNQEVALKLLNNSTNTDTNLLKEIALYKAFINETNNVVKCYGISQHPETKNYVIVMEYLRGDSLRKYLQNNYRELKFEDKLNQLSDIAQGLKDIHSQQNQNLVHGDFHSGNILYPPCRIIDLGLNEEGKGKVYGLMPYVAPEVLQSKPYTQASDIYSFGMIAYEIFSGLPPYHGSAYDISLSLQICRGTRPKFEIKIPELLKDLIERCWDDNPVNRPNIIKINELLERWKKEMVDKWEEEEIEDGGKSRKKMLEFYPQYLEAEKHNQTLPDEIKYPSREKHTGAVHNSKMIDTAEITQSLTQNITSGISSLEIDIDYIEEEVEQEQFQAHIEQPPKN